MVTRLHRTGAAANVSAYSRPALWACDTVRNRLQSHMPFHTRFTMKMKRLLLTLLCLLLFVITGYAQPEAPPQQPGNFVQQQKLPVSQHILESVLKQQVRPYWDGHAMALLYPYLHPDIRGVLDISDELNQKIKSAWDQGALQGVAGIDIDDVKNPEFQKLVEKRKVIEEEMHAIQSSPEFQKFVEEEFQRAGRPHAFIIFSPLVPPAAWEAFKRSQDVSSRMTKWLQHHAISEVMPPELMQKINESLLANMSELPVISPKMFEALGLTDAQKQQMETVRKALEPEFQKALDNLVHGQMIILNKALDELDKQGEGDVDLEAGGERMAVIQEKLRTEEPECKKIYEEIQSQGQAFVTGYKIKVFDVLSDEQWKRLQELIDNPPEYALVFRDRLREVNEGGSFRWLPSPRPWLTGEAIPGAYRQERNTRGNFPRPEN